MGVPRGIAKRLAKRLLVRIAAAGGSDRFTPYGLFPRDASRLATAFDFLIELDLVERVVERCGVWSYRLTAGGKDAAAAGKLPHREGEEKYPDDREVIRRHSFASDGLSGLHRAKFGGGTGNQGRR